jgi:HSP20 family protein
MHFILFTDKGGNMSAIIRRKIPHGITRQEFLTPFDRLFDDMVTSMFPSFSSDLGDDFFMKGAYPKVNVINRENSVEIDAAIPGMSKNDIHVTVSDGVLTIQGESNQKENVDDIQYLKREIKRSGFRRSFNLGDNLNQEDIAAEFDNGILTLTIQKLKPAKFKIQPRKIEIS